MPVPDYRKIYGRTAIEEAAKKDKSILLSGVMLTLIQDAIKKGFTNEEIDLFAKKDENGKFIYCGLTAERIKNAIWISGYDHPIISLMTRTYSKIDDTDTAIDALDIIYNAYYRDDISVAQLEALFPEDKPVMSRNLLRPYIEAIKAEDRTPEEIKKCVNSYYRDGKVTRAAIFEEPTLLQASPHEGKPKGLYFCSSLRYALGKISRTPYIDTLLKYILRKDAEGQFLLPVDFISDRLNLLMNSRFNPKTLDILSVIKSDGSYVFNPEYGFALLDAFDACSVWRKDDGDFYNQCLNLAVTDEYGTPLLTPVQIASIAATIDKACGAKMPFPDIAGLVEAAAKNSAPQHDNALSF